MSAQTQLLKYSTKYGHLLIPQSWKHSIIIPILKLEKNKFEVKSYRPISLLNTLAEILEKIMIWIPSYNQISGNERTDKKARQADLIVLPNMTLNP